MPIIRKLRRGRRVANAQLIRASAVRPRVDAQSGRPAAATGILLDLGAARLPSAISNIFSCVTFAAAFLGRQIGLRDLFGLGHVALQADHQRQIGPHARIGRAHGHRRGAASPRPSAGLSKARRTVRGWTAPTAPPARSSARSNNIAALPRTGRADRASRLAPRGSANPDCRGYGPGRARRRPAGNCHCRPARGRSRPAAPCCRDWRSSPAPAPRPPATSAPWPAAPCRIAAPRRRPSGWRDSAPEQVSTSRRGSAERLVSAFSPSEPVMSDDVSLAAAKRQRENRLTTPYTQEVARTQMVGAISETFTGPASATVQDAHSLTLNSG